MTTTPTPVPPSRTGLGATASDGRPGVALKGNLMVWEKDRLAWWDRAKRGTLAGVASDPRVAMFVRNPTRVLWSCG